jgi:hypothetical protein
MQERFHEKFPFKTLKEVKQACAMFCSGLLQSVVGDTAMPPDEHASLQVITCYGKQVLQSYVRSRKTVIWPMDYISLQIRSWEENPFRFISRFPSQAQGQGENYPQKEKRLWNSLAFSKVLISHIISLWHTCCKT